MTEPAPDSSAGSIDEDVIAGLRHSLDRATEAVSFPSAPLFTEGLQELHTWLADERQWLGGDARHWHSLLSDVVNSFAACGPAFRGVLDTRCGTALNDLVQIRTGLKASQGRRPPDHALRRRLQFAAEALGEALTEKDVLNAAWQDVVGEPDDEHRLAAARWLLALAASHGHAIDQLKRRLTGILADDLLEVSSARGDEIDMERRHDRAGLTADERIALAGDELARLPRSAHVVVWLFVSLAPMRWPWVLPIGESVTLFREDWLEEALAGDTDEPSGILLPERGEGRKHAWTLSRRVSQPRAEGDAPTETGDEIPRAVMRIDLGVVEVARAVELARETAQVAIAMTILEGGSPLTWRLEKSYALYIDGREAGGSVSAPLLWKPTPDEDDAVRSDRTLRVLEERGPEFGPHLPIRDQVVRDVAQLAIWFREAQRTWEPGRLVLYDRVLEQTAGWAGVSDVGGSIRGYLRLAWIDDRVRQEIRDAAWGAIFTDRRLFDQPGSPEAAWARELREDPQLGIRTSSDSWSINLQGVLLRLGWMLERVPLGPEHNRLKRLGTRVATGKSTVAWMKEIGEEFDALSKRARRTRNALIHGGPVSEATAQAVLPFVAGLAADSLWHCMDGRLRHEDLTDYFVRRQQKFERSRQRLSGGEPARKRSSASCSRSFRGTSARRRSRSRSRDPKR